MRCVVVACAMCALAGGFAPVPSPPASRVVSAGASSSIVEQIARARDAGADGTGAKPPASAHMAHATTTHRMAAGGPANSCKRQFVQLMSDRGIRYWGLNHRNFNEPTCSRLDMV